MATRRLELGMVVRHDRKLAEVTGIGEGRSVILTYLGEEPCPSCGRHGHHFQESAPLLQDSLEPVRTCDGV